MEVGCDLTPENSPALDIDEEAVFSLDNVRMIVDIDDLGEGLLVLGSVRIYFVPQINPGRNNVRIGYRALILHAVCTDKEVCSSPCIYCEVEKDSQQLIDGDAEKENDSNEDDEQDVHEIKLIPKDQSKLRHIFEHLNHLASLNSDPANPSNNNLFNTLGNSWCTAENADLWDPEQTSSADETACDTSGDEDELSNGPL